MEELKLHTRLGKELLTLRSGVVFTLADYPFDTTVDNKHCAGAARGHATIEGGPVQRDATAGGLADGILLSMNGTHAMGGNVAILCGRGVPLRRNGADLRGNPHSPTLAVDGL